MTTMKQAEYSKLEDLPSLRQGWVRLVHRCMKDHAESIKKNGLVFNREAAQLSPLEKGASYPNITSMASVYDEKSFWDSLCKDDFSCYDNAKYADTKIIFDMPLDEFCLLQTMGRRIKGRIDNKYIVGCVPNINGANEKLKQSVEKIKIAEQKSRANAPSSVQPNDVGAMVDELVSKCTTDTKPEMKDKIYKIMERCRGNLNLELSVIRNEGINLMNVMHQKLGR